MTSFAVTLPARIRAPPPSKRGKVLTATRRVDQRQRLKSRSRLSDSGGPSWASECRPGLAAILRSSRAWMTTVRGLAPGPVISFSPLAFALRRV